MKNKKHRWLILSKENEIHYIENLCDWYEALIGHVKWCQGNRGLTMYQKSFIGFDNMKEAIELFNTLFKYDEIKLMSPIDIENCDTYVNLNINY